MSDDLSNHKYDVQICFLSGQVDPNMFVLLHPELRPKQAYLLVSDADDPIKNSKRMKKALENQIEIHDESHFPAMDVKEIRQRLRSLITELTDVQGISKNKILVNITGGTKLMTIACYSLCQEFELPFIYLAKNKALIFSNNIDEAPREIDLSDIGSVYSIKAYLLAHGKEIIEDESKPWTPTKGAQKQFTNFMFSVMKKHRIFQKGSQKQTSLVSFINGITQAKDQTSLRLHNQVLEHLAIDERQVYTSFINTLKNIGYIEAKKEGYSFVSSDIKKFVTGGWMEQWVANTLLNLNIPSLKPWNIKFKADAKYANELDVVFFFKGILYVIEVKSADLSRTDGEKDIASKLITVCQESGGLEAKGCLITLQPVKEGMSLPKRLGEKNFEFIQFHDVMDATILSSKLKEWLGIKDEEK